MHVAADSADATRPTGVGRRFFAVALSQFLSALATALTAFGLNVWVFQTTRSVTAVSLLAMCSMLPRACATVLAGAAVDRYGARRAMAAGNLGSALCLLPPLLLFWQGRLEFWHICAAVAVASACQSLQWPAVSSSVPALVGERDFVRANGMLQTGTAAAGIIAPLAGGSLSMRYDVGVMLMITAAAYLVAAAPLALSPLPRRARGGGKGAGAGAGSYRAEIAGAWSFLRGDATLLRLAIIFASSSVAIAMASVLLKPLVLSFASASALGTVLGVGGLGMLLGGLLVTASGKGAKSFGQVMWLMAGAGLCMMAAGSRPAVPLIVAATFLYLFTMTVVSSGVQAIIQGRVPLDLQGRIHAMLGSVSLAAMPLAYPLAGPLADYVFEPMVAVGGPLADSVGRFIGVGPGRGIGLLFIILGTLIVGLSLIGQSWPQKQRRGANALEPSEQG